MGNAGVFFHLTVVLYNKIIQTENYNTLFGHMILKNSVFPHIGL